MECLEFRLNVLFRLVTPDLCVTGRVASVRRGDSVTGVVVIQTPFLESSPTLPLTRVRRHHVDRHLYIVSDHGEGSQ